MGETLHPLEDSYKHKGLRRALIEKLRQRGIRSESVLTAMHKVPRHVFFDQALLTHAYEDKAFPINCGQTISQPYTVAFQSELLGEVRGKRVLEIGTGSGYQACVLEEMGADVFSIEYHEALYKQTKSLLNRIGYFPHLFHGDGAKGLPAFAPYSAILMTAAAPMLPQQLAEQLEIGGRLVAPIGSRGRQYMIRAMKTSAGHLEEENMGNFVFVPLLGEEGF